MTVATAMKFWDRMADGYAKRPVSDEAAYQRKLALTGEHLRPDSRVLEFGCGTGTTALHHAPHVAHVHAVDLSPRMIDIARGKAAAAGIDNVDFQTGTLDDLDAGEGRYDVVLGMSILHLLERPEAAIDRVHALLRPGGVFVSSTACLGDWLKVFRIIGPLARWLGLLPLIRVFKASELEASLAAAGFAIEHHWQPARRAAVFIIARKPA